MRAAKVQASLCISAVSPEPSLLAHTSSESKGTFRQKTRSLAPLNGWACAVEICHDGMLEDTNSLDGAHIVLMEYDIKAKSVLQSSRKIFLYKRADMQGFKEHMRFLRIIGCRRILLTSMFNDMCLEFKTVFLKAVDKFILTKITKGKLGYQWTDARIRALVRKKENKKVP